MIFVEIYVNIIENLNNFNNFDIYVNIDKIVEFVGGVEFGTTLHKLTRKS